MSPFYTTIYPRHLIESHLIMGEADSKASQQSHCHDEDIYVTYAWAKAQELEVGTPIH